VIAEWQDISLLLDRDLPTWPSSPGVVTTLRNSIARGDVANVSQLNVDVHTGTHVDAPLHFVDGARSVDELGLEPFIGPALVVDTGAAERLTVAVLEEVVPDATERVLLRTVNSLRRDLYETPFDPGFAALTLDGAQWLAARGPRLVGIDYLSIQRFTEPPDVHRVLLGAGIAILEGLRLQDIDPGHYELVCLPMRLADVEGSPARAILLPPTK
jgi:arylformamidase